MNAIIRSRGLRVKPAALAVAALLFSVACSIIPPHLEHYMLRADYFRGLEEQRKKHEAEKATIRERTAGIQAEIAREEGRRIQVEAEAENLRRRLNATEARLDAALAEHEEEARVARLESEELIVSIERLKSELETTRAAIDRMKARAEAEVETSVILISDIAFARNATALTSREAGRIRALVRAFKAADHISIVGHAEARERPDAWRAAAARAAVVAGFIVDDLGIPPVKVTSVGRGAIAESGAANNRRVEIIAITRGASVAGE